MSKLREILFQAPDGDTTAAGPQSSPHPSSAHNATAFGTTQAHEAASQSQTAKLTLRASISGSKKDDALSMTPDRQYQFLKSKIHNRLIDSLDINALMELDDSDVLESAIEHTVHVLLDEERLPLSFSERQKLARDVLYETLGLGPLEPLFADASVNDILVNGSQTVWVDRNGRLSETSIRFKDDTHLLHVINRIVARVGRRVDESSPIVDARLPDGSRVNAIIPPLSIDGPILSIRRFAAVPFAITDLIDKKTLTSEMAQFLQLAVQAKLNILVSGGTSAGKTTLLNVLSGSISDAERIVTIEDTAELRLQQRHVIRLESRPANVEGQGSVTQRDLVKNALRMRPDRIVVGEVRGAEALDMLQAMNTGHEGSLTTVHANTPRDALSRLETLVLLAGVDLSQRSIREQIGSAFNLVVQIKRLTDGTRKVVNIAEITGVQEGVISMQDLFEFRQLGTASDGTVFGTHVKCGIRPQLTSRFKEAGLELPREMFAPTPEDEEAAAALAQEVEALEY